MEPFSIAALVVVGVTLLVVSRSGDYVESPSQKVKLLAEAIANAEGFYANGNPLPRRINNPGDLELGDIGFGVDQSKTVFPNLAKGWDALYFQLEIIRDGESRVYSHDVTFQLFASEYTGGNNWQNWLDTVLQHTGAQPGDVVAEWLN